ncbi:hypothetical protein NZK35_06335 [Stieleria sp. ICT_E10.1]|uniref:hypothetical protein n=1 Tax=Stieleria sedimenti TaxID=2976331 RepID=UPI00217F94DA|nr:hypothetical protein [Stieleria sedimenti]MCS7466292.1 hypothetical protein [Stieleria sedimenti]
MNMRPRWERCIHHRGSDAEEFVDDYFSRGDRQTLLIGGAGFDPRSRAIATQLSKACGQRLNGLFIREERPNATDGLREKADANDAEIRKLIPLVDIFSVDVFGIDNAPVGGRRATAELHKRMKLESVTDVVLDCSALSTGVMFPLARYCFEATKKFGSDVNFHIVVVDDPKTDAAIESTSCGKVSQLHTFGGGLTLDQSDSAAKLWLPQLGTDCREILRLIFEDVAPHAVCPIIPFPSGNPRAGDALIAEYGDLFEAISDPMTPTWSVDARDLVYTHERSPLDLYRSVLRIANARERVFWQAGGSQLILSPLGSKAVGIGLLMAAIERDFAVVSVETIEYRFADSVDEDFANGELVHVWMNGEAYRFDGEQDVES